MGAGIPVVAPAITGVPEIVEDDVSGILFRPGRADQMADGLLRILENAPLRSRLTQAAFRKIREEFDISVTALTMQRLFARSLTPAQPDDVLLPPSSPR
jgi:glycosyltransferase involved in cell wall biosynthesis